MRCGEIGSVSQSESDMAMARYVYIGSATDGMC